MSAAFRLDGQRFIAFNGGPMFAFSPAISFFVERETQAEIDELWEALAEGGEKQQCGWLKDRYGISWQIIPPVLTELLNDDDEAKAQRVLAAMLQMTKIEIDGLNRAAMS